MGYTTKFKGSFKLDKPLVSEHRSFFDKIAEVYHHPEYLPSCYCQWVVDETGTKIAWDGKEKFYGYIEWLCIVKLFLELLGYSLSGKVFWRGEDKGDIGTIRIYNGSMKIWKAKVYHENQHQIDELPF